MKIKEEINNNLSVLKQLTTQTLQKLEQLIQISPLLLNLTSTSEEIIEIIDKFQQIKENLTNLLEEFELILKKSAKDCLEHEDYYFFTEKCLTFDSVLRRVKKMINEDSRKYVQMKALVQYTIAFELNHLEI